MKVEIRGKVYDATKEPIIVILSDQDRKNINNMVSGATLYGVFPDGFSNPEAIKMMEDTKSRTDGS